MDLRRHKQLDIKRRPVLRTNLRNYQHHTNISEYRPKPRASLRASLVNFSVFFVDAPPYKYAKTSVERALQRIPITTHATVFLSRVQQTRTLFCGQPEGRISVRSTINRTQIHITLASGLIKYVSLGIFWGRVTGAFPSTCLKSGALQHTHTRNYASQKR